MRTENNTTQQQIIKAGYQLIANKGFSSVGLSLILATANVPKGSFYHYFKSKEQFGEALIQDFFTQYHQQIEGLIQQSEFTGLERTMRYWQLWLEACDPGESVDCLPDTAQAQRCLVVKLAAEVADLSESMRVALEQGTQKTIAYIADLITQGIKDGSICQLNAQQAAQSLYQMWLGASLLHKLHRNPTQMQKNIDITRSILENNRLQSRTAATYKDS